MKLIKISVLTTFVTVNVERRFSVLPFFLTKLRNALAPNSSQHSTKLMQLNYSHLKILKLNIYSSSLFLVTFFVSMLLDGKILLP